MLLEDLYPHVLCGVYSGQLEYLKFLLGSRLSTKMSNKTKSLLWVILFLVSFFCAFFCPPIFAQGGRTDNVIFKNGVGVGGVNVAVCQPLATTAASVTSNIATYTMASNPQTAGYVAGMQIQVAGFTGGDTYFNAGTITNNVLTGGQLILSVTPTTINTTLTHANASAGTNGTILQFGNSTTPCAGLSNLYTDSTLGTLSGNPIVSDGLGNYGFWAASGQYYVQSYGPTATTQIRSVSVSGVGGGGTVTNVTASIPIVSSGGATPNISCPTCTTITRVIYAADQQWAGGVFGDGAFSCVAVMATGSQTVLTDPGTSTVTNTSLTANVALITSVQNFQVGDVVSVSGTSNGGGIFNQPNVTITVVNPGVSFSFALVHANVGSSVDTGTVQGPSVDKPFVNATIANGGDIGDIVFGTNMPCAGNYGFDFTSSTLIVPVGTITAVNGPHSVQVSIASTGNCTGSINTGVSCEFGWFRHDDTAALQAAFNAAINPALGQSNCGTLVIPVGNILISAPIVNQTTRCGVQVAIEAAPIEQGFSVVGQGPGQTRIIPSPSLDASTAVNSGIGGKIFFGSFYVQSANFANFSINGLGNDTLINGNGKCILYVGWNSSLQNVSIINWGNINTNTNIGLCSAAAVGGPNYISNYMNYNGGAQCAYFQEYTTASGVQCLTYLGAQMANGEIYTVDSFFGNGDLGSTTAAVRVLASAVWKSSNDLIQANSPSWCAKVTGTVYWSNMHCYNGGNGGNGGGLWLDSGGIAHVSNSAIGTRSPGPLISANGGSGGSYFDSCGNSFDAASGVVVPTNIQFYGQSCSVTGSPLVTGNLVLSAGWGGTRATSAWLGATSPVSFTITNGAAGVGASPTITYTFPTPFYSTPLWCNATQVGGTNPSLSPFTTSALTSTSVVFTATGTPTVNDTELMQVQCASQ